MNPRISIDFDPAEGAVVRMLGLIERRGFEVRAIGMTEPERGAGASMMLDLAARGGNHSLATLSLQLRRLQGVRHIATVAPEGALS